MDNTINLSVEVKCSSTDKSSLIREIYDTLYRKFKGIQVNIN